MRYLILLAVLLSACSSSPTSPTPPVQTPQSSTITLRGLVRSIIDGRSVSGAAVTIAFSGQTTTSAGDGTYALTFVPRAGVPTTTIQVGGATVAYVATKDVSNIDNTFTVHDVIPTGSGFDPGFYKAFVHNAFENPSNPQPLRRQSQAPRIYLRTIDDAGVRIDTNTLDQTAAALINTAGSFTGVFGLAGLEQGTDTREGQPGWITVRWSGDVNPRVCGEGFIGGNQVILYYRTPGCRCAGGPAIRLRTVKHELGHVLGFYHTGTMDDLMSGLPDARCDQNPSAREILHSRVAYSMEIGSLDP